ncbi:MAG: glucosamine-6-phosphate deaminase [Planctomycetota bacterium JB042]
MQPPSREFRVDRLRVVIHATPVAAAAAVSAEIAARLAEAPATVLGLATGRTPIPVYEDLVRRHRRGEISFARATTFNLDEYWPIDPGDEASFRRFMEERLFSLVDLPAERRHLPDGAVAEADVERACRRYEEAIAAAGGVDLQLLGVGRNGHLGFNEPGSAFDSRTRRVRLSESTRAANREAFAPGAVPRHAVTMGLGTILEARRPIALATGRTKAEAVARALLGAAGVDVPASALRTHRGAALHLDAAAAEAIPAAL